MPSRLSRKIPDQIFDRAHRINRTCERESTIIGSNPPSVGRTTRQWIVGLSTAMVERTCWRARLQDSTSA